MSLPTGLNLFPNHGFLQKETLQTKWVQYEHDWPQILLNSCMFIFLDLFTKYLITQKLLSLYIFILVVLLLTPLIVTGEYNSLKKSLQDQNQSIIMWCFLFSFEGISNNCQKIQLQSSYPTLLYLYALQLITHD